MSDPNDFAGAKVAYERIASEISSAVIAKLGTSNPESRPRGRDVAACVREFLSECAEKVRKGKLEPGSMANYRNALTPFASAFCQRNISEISAEEIEEWANRPAWTVSTQHSYLGIVATLLRWAKVQLRIRRPPAESRGADTILTEEQFSAVLDAIPDKPRRGGAGDLKHLLRVLRETGARPQEIARLKVEDVDWANQCVTLRQHKTKKKTGRDRRIYFNAAAVAVLTQQRAKYGSGLLFRTKMNNAYQCTVICHLLGRVGKRLGFRVIAYGLGRHSFATRALVAGVPDAIVGELLGHKGTEMVTRNYGHIGAHSRVLRDAAEKASERNSS